MARGRRNILKIWAIASDDGDGILYTGLLLNELLCNPDLMLHQIFNSRLFSSRFFNSRFFNFRFFNSRPGRAIALSLCLWLVMAVTSVSPASALIQVTLSDLDYKDCPPEIAEGYVVAGSSQAANCFIVTGTATNPTNKPIYNADVFGRIYDANNNPVMQNRTRLGSIDDVPPGDSQFELRISVAANQPTPLKLEQFKATGFTGRVRR
ncbi:MAG: FxLYD domain-containing protein [Leptolyngbyaceae bacterium]|nr:FxLYD domain-containing protein [Leptolyngbyaceae bacterium]